MFAGKFRHACAPSKPILASRPACRNIPIVTTANKITICRILLVPFFIAAVIYYSRTGIEMYRYGALLSFGLASLGDAVDGYVARHFNQKSELGAILDPLADKLLLTAAILLLSFENHRYFERLPVWLTITVLSRDLIILMGMALIHYIVGKVKVRARWVGKISTILLISTVSWILLDLDARVLPYLVGMAGFFTAVSGLFYIFDGACQLNSHPASAPAPSQE